MHVLLFANGEPPSAELIDTLRRQASLVVAADGGSAHALAFGITPDIVIGDLDSITPAIREHIPAANFIADRDPDRTDLQKALDHVLVRGASEVTVVCGGGGRVDHALGNLSLLPLFRGRLKVRLVDDLFEVTLVEGTATVDGPLGTVVSLVAVSGTCEGVTTTGLRWNLNEHTLRFSPYGIHNEVAAHPATIAVRSGDLLLFRGRWVEKHS